MGPPRISRGNWAKAHHSSKNLQVCFYPDRFWVGDSSCPVVVNQTLTLRMYWYHVGGGVPYVTNCAVGRLGLILIGGNAPRDAVQVSSGKRAEICLIACTRNTQNGCPIPEGARLDAEGSSYSPTVLPITRLFLTLISSIRVSIVPAAFMTQT